MVLLLFKLLAQIIVEEIFILVVVLIEDVRPTRRIVRPISRLSLLLEAYIVSEFLEQNLLFRLGANMIFFLQLLFSEPARAQLPLVHPGFLIAANMEFGAVRVGLAAQMLDIFV